MSDTRPMTPEQAATLKQLAKAEVVPLGGTEWRLG